MAERRRPLAMHRTVADMHERHRRSRSLLVSLLVLVAAGAICGGRPPLTLRRRSRSRSTRSSAGSTRRPRSRTRTTARTACSSSSSAGRSASSRAGSCQPGYFLDIRSKVADGGERGLLGLAFHPNFTSNHRFFVYYTRNGGDIVVVAVHDDSARTRASAEYRQPPSW